MIFTDPKFQTINHAIFNAWLKGLLPEHPNFQTVEQYTYDAVGNRLSGPESGTYTYNAANEMLTALGMSFTYDANGNIATKTSSPTARIYSYKANEIVVFWLSYFKNF